VGAVNICGFIIFAARKNKAMKIGILAAMSKEIQLILPHLEGKEETRLRDLEAWKGRIGVHDVCVAQCGIGKVNSALRTQRMLDEFDPDLVINTGVAGGADASMRVLDLFVAVRVAYHDVWCGPETDFGAASGLDVFLKPDTRVVDVAHKVLKGDAVKFGLICSGDRFICKEEEVEQIKLRFPACLAVDMESASIAQVCVLRGVPFSVIRAISDTPGQEENISQYENFWNDAPVETLSALVKVIEGL